MPDPPRGRRWKPGSCGHLAMDGDLAEAPDFEAIAWPHHRGRAVFLDDGRPGRGESRFERKTVVHRGFHLPARAAEVHTAPGWLPSLRRAPAGKAREIGPLHARERRQVQRLDLHAGLRIGVSVA